MSYERDHMSEVAGAKPAPPTVGFRLDEISRQILGQRASKLGISPHELAKFYVTELLSDREERSALREVVAALHQEIKTLRKDFVFATEVLLSSAGKVDEKTAQAWAKKNFDQGT